MSSELKIALLCPKPTGQDAAKAEFVSSGLAALEIQPQPQDPYRGLGSSKREGGAPS